jgi:hypothetical protein
MSFPAASIYRPCGSSPISIIALFEEQHFHSSHRAQLFRKTIDHGTGAIVFSIALAKHHIK